MNKSTKFYFSIKYILMFVFSLFLVLSIMIIISEVNAIYPDSGNFDTLIPISCEYNFSNQNLSYYIEAQYDDGINFSWRNLTQNASNDDFNFITTAIPNQNNISIRCRYYNLSSSSFSSYNYNTHNLSIYHQNYVKLFYAGFRKKFFARKLIPMAVVCNINNTNNMSVLHSYLDCNGDGLWDYTDNYINMSFVSTVDYHNCYYKLEGNYSITGGCILTKDANSEWDKNICKLDKDKEYCDYYSSYVIEVL